MTTKRGKFVVIEGIDGSGKVTQFNLLKKRLASLNYKLLVADFPRYYSSIWGKLVGRFLAGEFGDLEDVDPHLAVLTYMLDQYTWSREVATPWIKKGGWILTNRYFTANVHQIARLRGRLQKKFREWLWPAGYNDLKILRPDLVIFVDTKPEVAKILNGKKKDRPYLKGKREDIAEEDWEHQMKAYREYKRTVKENDWWVAVSGVKDAGKDYSQKIHKEVWDLVQKRLI